MNKDNNDKHIINDVIRRLDNIEKKLKHQSIINRKLQKQSGYMSQNIKRMNDRIRSLQKRINKPLGDQMQVIHEPVKLDMPVRLEIKKI